MNPRIRKGISDLFGMMAEGIGDDFIDDLTDKGYKEEEIMTIIRMSRSTLQAISEDMRDASKETKSTH